VEARGESWSELAGNLLDLLLIAGDDGVRLIVSTVPTRSQDGMRIVRLWDWEFRGLGLTGWHVWVWCTCTSVDGANTSLRQVWSFHRHFYLFTEGSFDTT
jgi:hypothetical protein